MWLPLSQVAKWLFSGIGGFRVHSSGEVIGFFSEEVPKGIESIQAGAKETAILELEIVAISVAGLPVEVSGFS